MQNILKLTDVIKFLGKSIIAVHGNPDTIEIKYLKDAWNVDEFTLDWINPTRSDKQVVAVNSKAKAIISGAGVEFTETLKNQGKVLLIVENPKWFIAQVANEYFISKVIFGIHSSAIIHPQAKIGKNVFIGPNCIIGKCDIGDYSFIEGNNYIYDNVILKKNIEIHAGAIIGSEAHNFVEDEKHNKIKFPHLGGVIIENNVLVGAQTVISRGVLSNTIIGEDTKIAQLVYIGANNIIGNNCAIRPNVMTSGSVTIGKDSIVAPSSTIRDQRIIGDNCFIGMGAVVTKDIPAGETWVGNPARKMEK
jgi:UDP-3-O-[3-hydroxymyristoyl] glucosamine N-acyltransferase